LLHFSKTIT